MDTEMEQPKLEQEINLMPYHQQVNTLASTDLEAEKALSDQGDSKILGDNPEEEMHKIWFDESQHRVVKSHRVSTLDVHTSPAKFAEWLIVSDMRKHPIALADATRAYAKATSSSVHFLIAENRLMAKELQTTKQGGERVTASARAELNKEILDEVSSLETVMWVLYSKFGTMHKKVLDINSWQ